MEPVRIQVQCYAGYKAAETPRRFVWQGREIEVAEVLERWAQTGRAPEEAHTDCFIVAAEDGHRYLLSHDLGADEWRLVNRW